MGKPSKERTPITCRCGARWTATGAAHCGADGCHETFSGLTNFDLHRSMTGEHGHCRPPASITNNAGERLLFFRRGMWRNPEMSEEDKAARFGEVTG